MSRRQQRGVGLSSVDPRTIRAALADFRAGLTLREAAARHAVSTASITRWRNRSDLADAAGGVWPSDDDVAYWEGRQPTRAVTRRRQTTWRMRSAASGGRTLIPAIGAVRRVRALAALGWRQEDIAALMGVSAARVGNLVRQPDGLITRNTAAAVDAVYSQLSMRPGPSAETRARARQRGWAPPLAWDDDAIDDRTASPHCGRARRGGAVDEVAVQRAMAGRAPYLRPAERAEAVRRLTELGVSTKDIAGRLGASTRAVTRHRVATDSSRRSA